MTLGRCLTIQGTLLYCTVKVVALAEPTGVAGGTPADMTVHNPSLRTSDSVLTAHERYSQAARRGLSLAMRKGDRTRPARNVQVSKVVLLGRSELEGLGAHNLSEI
ncbi:hypothetical protein B0H14DRAFT_2687028 [Mycena olivaceomarginata]|nr:hypothetical protein B0H14DRAFT_2687028 [Mycena olivaceomarginata]